MEEITPRVVHMFFLWIRFGVATVEGEVLIDCVLYFESLAQGKIYVSIIYWQTN